MTTGHVFIATSLDGFIARPDNSLDWLMKQPVQDEDHGFDAFMAGVDRLIMGRATIPVLIGEGRRLFGPVPKDIDLRLQESRSSPSGLVSSRYEIVGHTPE